MPELPELETIVRGLRPRVMGHVVTSARLRHKSLYRRGSATVRRLTGRTIAEVERVGKNAVFWFEPEHVMVVNLGMTGQLMLCRDRERPPSANPKHLHGVFQLNGHRQLRFYDARRFGHIYVSARCDFMVDLNIGPDPFIVKARYLRNALRPRRAPIKSLLLDQRLISGIGNIYADETLFLARIHPRTPGASVAPVVTSLMRSARTIMRRAIDHGGSTVRDYRRHDGTEGGFQSHHAVYGREGMPCVACGTPIRRIVLSGRSTHFCPSCQRDSQP